MILATTSSSAVCVKETVIMKNTKVNSTNYNPDSEKYRYSVSNLVNRYMDTSHIECKNSSQGCTSSIAVVGTRQS